MFLEREIVRSCKYDMSLILLISVAVLGVLICIGQFLNRPVGDSLISFGIVEQFFYSFVTLL